MSGNKMREPEKALQRPIERHYPSTLFSKLTPLFRLSLTIVYNLQIPASGASLNPARSLGPAFIMNRWDQHWVSCVYLLCV